MTVRARITVVIPTYNRRHTIERALRSVFAQTLQPEEIWVVDDASRDDTEAVVAALRDPRIRYHRFDTNRGANAARNVGVERATGDVIAFLDSDDEWRPDKLEKQMAALASLGPEGVLVSSLVSVVGPDGPRPPAMTRSGPVTRARLSVENVVGSTSAAFVRRAAILAAGGFDERLKALQDWELWLRLLDQGHLFVHPEPLTLLHIDAGVRITHGSRNRVQGYRRIVQRHFSRRSEAGELSRRNYAIFLGTYLLSTGKPRMARRALHPYATASLNGTVTLLGLVALIGRISPALASRIIRLRSA